MNKRFVSVFVFAVVVAGVASVVLYRLIALRFAVSAKPAVTQVIGASRKLEVGTLIRDQDVTTINWTGAAPATALLKKEDAIGRGVISEIYPGEPLLEARLAPKGAGAGLAALIPPGMRAVAVRVNDIVGVAGFLVPGSRVDVLISGIPPSGGASALGTQTKTILQNIEVISAGQNIQKDAEGKPISVPVVNLMVTPEQAEILSLAGTDTRIQLVLRNPLDAGKEKPPGVALSQLFSGAAKPVAPAPKPRVVKAEPPAPPPPPPAQPQVVHVPVVVEVLTGSKKAEAKFERTEVHQ